MKKQKEDKDKGADTSSLVFFKDVLSKSLKDRDFCFRIMQHNLLRSEHFPSNYLQWTYATLKAYMDNPKYGGELPSMQVFKHRLEHDESVSVELKVNYFRKIEELYVRKSKNAAFSLEVIEKRVRFREFKFLLEETIDNVGKHKDPDVAISNLLNKSFKISSHSSAFSIVDLVENFKERQEKRLDKKINPGKYKRFMFGVSSIDDCLPGGLYAPMFASVAAKTGIGKSIITVDVGCKALEQGFHVTHVTSENEIDQTTGRYDSRLSNLRYDDIQLSRLSGEDTKILEQKYQDMEKIYRNRLKLVKFPPNDFTTASIMQVLNHLESQGHKTDFLIVDGPDLMQSVNTGLKDKRLQQSSIYWELKALLEQKKCIGFGTTQLKAMSDDDDPSAENLSESYDKARLLDFVLVITRNKTQRANHEASLLIVKNRDGKIHREPAIIETRFDRMTYTEKPPEEVPTEVDDTDDKLDKQRQKVKMLKEKGADLGALRIIALEPAEEKEKVAAAPEKKKIKVKVKKV